jgi:hypothetical protein
MPFFFYQVIDFLLYILQRSQNSYSSSARVATGTRLGRYAGLSDCSDFLF